jgi:hypothetical protein
MQHRCFREAARFSLTRKVGRQEKELERSLCLFSSWEFPHNYEKKRQRIVVPKSAVIPSGPWSHNLPTLQSHFEPEDFLSARRPKETRLRKFTPVRLFHTMAQLVAGANQEGYSHALLEVFEPDVPAEDVPAKSALCRLRQKVSFRFFESIFDQLVHRFDSHRTTFRGLIIYAIDGQMLTLPRTKDVMGAGYTGRAIGDYRESYMPRAYLTHCYDVLSGVSKDLRFGPDLNETRDAFEMIENLEKNSLTLYDRLYFHEALAKGHGNAGNFYLARCKKNASKEIDEFYKDSWRKKKTVKIGDETVHLIKVWNPSTNEWDVYATNLSRSWRNKKLIFKLYRLRWAVETSFFELTAIAKVEQWHSKFINGIMQELFTLFWLINYTKIQIFFRAVSRRNPLRDEYRKPNFKLLFNYIRRRLHPLFQRVQGVLDGFASVAKRSTERRKCLSRRHPREIRGPASPYPYNNTVWVIGS